MTKNASRQIDVTQIGGDGQAALPDVIALKEAISSQQSAITQNKGDREPDISSN
jgi:hypothetical protein